MNHPPKIYEFWERAKKSAGITGDFQDAWGFGDSPELKNDLLKLVLEGRKTATTSLVKENVVHKWPEAYVGAFNIILDGMNEPRLVIETTYVGKCRFIEVTAEHASLEGEDDGSLKSWRREHRKYWNRVGKLHGFHLDDDDIVIVERFRVRYKE